MGNYYTGDVVFELKKDSKKIQVLRNLAEYKYTTDEEFKESEIGKSGLYARLNIELGYRAGDNCYTELEEGSSFDSYLVMVSVCSKAFRDGKTDAVTMLLDYLNDEIIQIDDPIGQVKDEDFTFRKIYFTNRSLEDKFITEINKNRKKVCNGCDLYNEDCYCDNYDLCKAAFDRGVAYNE